VRLKKLISVIMVVGSIGLVAGMGYKDFQRFCDESVPILAYHRVEPAKPNDTYTVPPEIFEQQMKYLHEAGYTTMNLDKYAAARKKHETLHKKIVLIFDDGYLDNLTVAAPIMQKYGFTGSMFMAVKFEGWTGYLDWNQQHDLLKYNWEIGSHTYNHIPLPELSPEEVKEDLAKSKEYVQGIYNPPGGITLSYPTGATNKKVMQQVKEAGYIAAVAGYVGVNTDTTDMMALKRVNIFNYRKMQKIETFKLAILKAQLKSWSASHGLDVVGMWDRLRGNAKS